MAEQDKLLLTPEQISDAAYRRNELFEEGSVLEYTRRPDADEAIAKAQAEISVKAGRREVVEWLERVRKIKVPKYQLKDWGIENES